MKDPFSSRSSLFLHKAGDTLRTKLAREDGVVIIAALWITALIMWFALQISVESRLKGEEQVHQIRKSQALHLAIGGCYEALARMGQNPSDLFSQNEVDAAWMPNGHPNVVQYETGQAVVYIESEKEKINVNSAPPDVLATVIERAGLPERDAEHLAQLIGEFIRPGDSLHMDLGEGSLHGHETLQEGGFGGPLTSIHQLLLIPGVTHQLFYGHHMPRRDSDQARKEERPPSMPQHDSLFDMFTIHGNNILPETFEEEDFTEKIYTWESGGIYRILSWGVSAAGPPGVVIWLVVRFAPGTESGYEILQRKVL